MIIFLLKMTPLPSKRWELLNILRSVTGPTLIQPGCLACEIYESSEDDQAVLYLEKWDSSADIHKHIKTALYARLLTAIELSAIQPDIHFYETEQISGIELIESLRIIQQDA